MDRAVDGLAGLPAWSWLAGRIKDEIVDMSDLAAVLGRLCFALGPLDHARPFLAPIYAWAAAVGRRGRVRVPWAIRFLFHFLAEEFSEDRRAITVRPRSEDVGMAFRADAKAEGQLACVGGWECLGGVGPSEARWFSLELTRENAPWAFSRGEPFRTIAALELFATLLCIVAFGDKLQSRRGMVGLSGVTDNLGSTFVLARMMSSKFPLVVILTEVAAQLRARGLELGLQWAPREQNEEADALTNGDFSLFDPRRRVEVNLHAVAWEVLPGMLKASEEIHSAIQRAKLEKPAPAQGRKARPEEKLRARDPW